MQRIKYRGKFLNFIVFALIILSVLSVGFLPITNIVSAEKHTAYSNALSDLKRAENFDIKDYPYIEEDYSLSVIQVAESSDRDVFVYVYQPCGKLVATSINMARQKYENFDAKLYNLELLNSNGVFFKYKIEGLTATSEVVRHYNIFAIYRAKMDNLDADITDLNITERAYKVGTCYSISTGVDGSYLYGNTRSETIEITTKWTSFIRYTNESVLFPANTDSFFVAFSTDKQIDSLREAKLTYKKYTYDCYNNIAGGGIIIDGDHTQIASINNDVSEMALAYGHYSDYTTHNHSEIKTVTKELSASNSEEIVVGGLFKKKYSWKEIEPATTFLNENKNNLGAGSTSMIADKDWVLRFDSAKFDKGTEYLMASPIKNYEKGTVVEDVTILLLTFETEGVTYSMGVVDNKQDSTTTPAGITQNRWQKIRSVLIILLVLVASALVISLISPFLPVLFQGIAYIAKWICQGLWWFVKNLSIGIYYIIKYLGIGIYYFFAWPFIIWKNNH